MIFLKSLSLNLRKLRLPCKEIFIFSYLTILNNVLMPSIFGILLVIIYAKGTLNRFYSNIKILLFTIEEKKPKKVSENFELAKRFNDIIKNEYEINKKIIIDEDSQNKQKHSINDNEDNYNENENDDMSLSKNNISTNLLNPISSQRKAFIRRKSIVNPIGKIYDN